ncbi:hypothetical protein HOF56_01545 [Candidatus Peribacteria bacterium]|jgi:hypothetical protein|nr:hypothetical protein [Candidatus Peribacteria bacterium]MBT4020775.1 hypothetical protein [Candidatus Peribacteria bacterium]MBT4241055.1 hypothetical protein [Candidatus Peribacteria bacterium]MBT4474446.1 hypothetical protein [Candidatus Peribacteria bacterium]
MKLTIPPNRFSIDGIPTEVDQRVFNGEDSVLPKIIFINPDTGECSFERSAMIRMFTFSGTALLTPSAFNSNLSHLNVDTLDRPRLHGDLLILNLQKGVAYTREEIKNLLEECKACKSLVGKIVLLRTQLMASILNITDNTGTPDYNRLSKTQKDRPGLTANGAVELSSRSPSAIMVDNISFELQDDDTGFSATQRLAVPDGDGFVPLVYHVGNTQGEDFVDKCNGKRAHIELGNPPEGLSGYPAGVYIDE